jgi:TolB-like protein/class 3 adenylate cyclase
MVAGIAVPDRTSRILTLVFTDLVQSTALKTQQGDRVVGTLLARHRAHAERLAEESGGRIVAWAGDGCFLTFDAPSAALHFALGLQHAHGAERDLPGVRVGIHAGEVTERADHDGRRDVEGLAVDVAARMAGLARPGQILLSAAVSDATRTRLEAAAYDRPVRVVMHGRYALKGVDGWVEIAEIGLDGIAPFAAPDATDKAAPIEVADAAKGRRRRAWWAAAALVLFSLVALGLALRPFGGAPAGRQPITSLAVLPFRNFSGDPEQEYFVDGMTEALIAELAKIKSVKVISRTSAMRYKGTDKPLPQVARELGIDGVVEGSVYKGGNEVRITAQLIRGATDEHLWSDSYTESLENVLRLQARVALAISDEIQATLSSDERRRLQSARLVDPRAHEAFLKGYHFYNEGTVQGLADAGRHFRDAIRYDPTYADAYALLGLLYILPNFLAVGNADPALARGLTHEALRLDPDCAIAHAGLGWITYVFDWNWSESEAEFRRAMEIDPSAPWGAHGLSDVLANIGRGDEAVAAAETALARDPLAPYTNWQYASVLWIAHRYDASVTQYARVRELAPEMTSAFLSAADASWSVGNKADALRIARAAVGADPNPSNRAYLAYRLALAGDRDEARRTLDQALADADRGYVVPGYVAWALAALGDVDGAIRWTERTMDERDYNAVTMNELPQWDPLRGDARFQALLRRMHFPADAERASR